MPESTDLYNRIGALEGRVGSAEARVVHLEAVVDNQLASQAWVRQLVEPLADATREIKHAVETLSRDNQSLNAAHNKLLEERALQEKAEHDARMKQLESQTWSNILKEKWAPLAAFLVALAIILGHIMNVISVALAHGASLAK